MIKNTSYKLCADVATEEIRLQYNIEEGAIVTTSAGVWTVWNGEWRKIYPSAGTGSGLGWVRYDDGTYTSSNKLTVTAGETVTLPNDATNIIRSHSGINYYDSENELVVGENINDLYLATIVFKASTTNANQGYGHILLEQQGDTPYERLHGEFVFPKGNNVAHDIHRMFQYYIDADFIENGAEWQVAATGANIDIWDIIFFISKVQSYA